MGTQAPEPTSGAGRTLAIVLVVLVIAGVGGFLANRGLRHVEQLNTRIDTLEETLQRTEDEAVAARQLAVEAERSARLAAASRADALDDAELARQEADDAGQRAAVSDQRAATAEQTSRQAEAEARLAREQADEIRRVAEAEMNRLTDALGRIAETRRTALGLVMSLDEGYLKFDFDRAELRPAGRELLSRIVGILFTTDDFAITVSGHSDTRGDQEYNQELSERRAQAVADYLVAAGLSADLFTVEGLGKLQPLDPGDTEEAHSRNRRVELGFVNARIIRR
jgi:outer membrane protein OmpA-like peptidoglycan-associated protein